MRKPLIAGNWKMFKTLPEALALVGALRDDLGKGPVAREVLVAPPFTALHAVAKALAGSGILVAAQNMHHEREGAFTGEVAPPMLKDAGASHVILGHSERRQLFGETDDGVGRKARACFDHGLTPIACVGETLDEREAGRIFEVVERQLDRALQRLTPDEAATAVVAYEPVWAIGTGKVATPEQAQEVHASIRKRISVTHGDAVAKATRILYGGSVKPDNVDGLMAQPDIDGALVGGACLKADSFLRIVRFNR
ncbi:MAG TPA: triose-phosphate isomerase [Vicinamibacteria bacterium]|nr:triose-phosphate isomerase [Vicinamibacteria bacterium]